MKKILKVVGYLAGIFLAITALALVYVKTMLPSVGDAPDLKVEINDKRMERGKYLANHVMVCMDCHSKRNWNEFSGPLLSGTEGMGGEVFDQKFGFPGKYVASNITPANLSSWTDGEIFRAITAGVSKDGRALFPVMPHQNFGRLDEEDIKCVIAYLRTLKPIDNQTAQSVSDFPMNFIINTIPKKADLRPMPDASNLIAYGKYLATAASCFDCHTKQEKGKFIGAPYAGGMEFPFPDGSIVRSMNITPHASGIGNWTGEQFVQRFKAYGDSTYVSPPVKPGDFQSTMPWTMYAQMSEPDLQAIYTYLRSIEPVNNPVERFTGSSQ